MEKKILPTLPPLITNLPDNANLLSIIDINNHSLSWIYHNFSLLYLEIKDELHIGYDFCSEFFPWNQFKWPCCPLIELWHYPKFIVGDIITFVRQQTDAEFYVYLNTYRSHMNNIHETFITGYNNDSFLCWDFWPENHRVYSSKWISFDEFETMYENSVKYDDWMNGIYAITKKTRLFRNGV